MRLRGLSVLVLVFCLAGLATAAHAERRVALLIGNAAYRDAPLRNPVNDVAAMKATLTAAGFDTVIARTDLDRAGMLKALRSFEDAVAAADIGVVFYSGHGIEFRGQNYLIPVDAQLDSDRDIDDQAINLDRVLDSLEGAKKLKLVLLDACRSNPFIDNMRRIATKGPVAKGLVRVEATTANMLIAYAAAPGHVALDGTGANSPFTAALVRHLTTPGVEVQMALRRVRDDVVAATDQKQVPFETESLGGDAIALGRPAAGSVMLPPPAVAAPPPQVAPPPSAMLHPPKPDVTSSSEIPLSEKPTLVASFGSWKVYEARDARTKICFAMSQPQRRSPKDTAQRSAYMFLSHRPGEGVHEEFSILTGVPLSPAASPVDVIVDDRSISLIARGEKAWPQNSGEESQLVTLMKQGKVLKTKIDTSHDAASSHVVTDDYSLSGFQQASSRAAADCP